MVVERILSTSNLYKLLVNCFYFEKNLITLSLNFVLALPPSFDFNLPCLADRSPSIQYSGLSLLHSIFNAMETGFTIVFFK